MNLAKTKGTLKGPKLAMIQKFLGEQLTRLEQHKKDLATEKQMTPE